MGVSVLRGRYWLAASAFCFGYSADSVWAQISPAMPSPIYAVLSGSGKTGGDGGDADCSKAWYGEGKPHDGGTGGAGTSFSKSYSATLNASQYGTGVVVTSVGGTGGVGGYGSTCYGGRAGGTGGSGGAISIGYSGAMSIPGSGIIAVSQGGEGGGGGNTNSTYNAGNGGTGGVGGTVTLTNSGTILTTSSSAFGLYGLSMGGNGGDGGRNKDAVYGSGGSGQYGGLGGQVTLINNGTITTSASYGLLGISVGGYGGDAGGSAGFIPSPNSSAGGGGPGGNVTLTNNGNISTGAFGQAAMVAISVGGGGGDAGRTASLVALGNTGGKGANGGTLILNNSGTVQTYSTGSVGLAAVGVGGGGGMGGMAAGSLIGGGGSGGGGGVGATISVFNDGSICTGGGCSSTAAQSSGGQAPAIAAISAGGGGGMGGYGVAAGTVASIAIGGAGGNGGAGGPVSVDSIGSLRTAEVSSPGLIAASVGGGGGSGGGAFSATAGYVGMALSLGGSGGSGGAGGTVAVNCGQTFSNSSASTACNGASALGSTMSGASITTLASSSPGVVAMSVGGGGGSGGFAISLAAGRGTSASISVGGKGGSGGNGGAVYAATGGVPIATSGAMSSGLVALSVGGGGGIGGATFYMPDYVPSGAVANTSLSVSVGGSGGNGGTGGAVTAENVGSAITLNGDRGSGIFAASIGGRGGHGGLATSAALGASLAITSSVGGNGGSGNTGGTVNVYNTAISQAQKANITTYGADSHGIMALSVGGGGGAGGWSASAGVALGPTATLSVGGTGGTGGNGGLVNVANTGSLLIYGRGGAGIFAASVGGGGGNGGSSASGDVTLSGAFTSTVGGNGGGGGKGGTVTVSNTALIAAGIDTYQAPTDPARATQGILAMSIGGGGGRGGLAVGGDVSLDGSPYLQDTVGGGAGAGGTGGTVTVTNSGTVRAFGDMSNAVTAVSIGGRGGMGGIAIGGGYSTDLAMGVTVGSNGGTGGAGGAANASNTGTIQSGGFTVPGSSAIVGGFRAMGLVAQSIGGHGGMGGISVGATLSPLVNTTGSVTLGGSGGKGGVAGSATVSNYATGAITTNGPFSAGMVAQSIGGDGGMGGLTVGASTSLISPSTILGGSGGSGAIGGTATATNYGTVTTSGLNSVGILSQSIGGNGGLSGVTVAAGSAQRAGQFGIGLGNSAGNGANGGAAIAYHYKKVTTEGALSTGIAVESIGGGGGRAAGTFSLNVRNAANLETGLSNVQVGATGGGGGNGGAASLTTQGTVSTTGAQSDALYVGSIGGGGGSGGLNFFNLTVGNKSVDLLAGGQSGAPGNGGTVTVHANDTVSALPLAPEAISTSGAFSHGLLAQSLGGGGGNASALHSQSDAGGLVSSQMRLGGTGSSSGSGGAVNVNAGGTFTHEGPASSAIVAQSIGGGGGQTLSGLISAQTTITIPGSGITLTAGTGSAQSSGGSSGTSTSAPSSTISLTNVTATTITAGSAASMALGGFSTSAASGGAVTVNSSAQITTSDVMSNGIKAQSVGGGGGLSNFLDSNSASPFAASTMTLGGGSSGGGYGGAVTVTNSNTIGIYGGLSTAISAQSLGGGGGDARHVSLAALTGATSAYVVGQGIKSGAAGGYASSVSVTNTGGIVTAGFGSDALVAQSIGGGGGISAKYNSGAEPPAVIANASNSTGSSQAGTLSAAQSLTSASSAFAGLNSGQTNTGSSVSTVVGASMAAVLGAAGGSSNYGGSVTVTNNATISTGSMIYAAGDGSLGVIAQSIGAGGGLVREHSFNFDQSQSSISLKLGGMNNASGNGGVVSVTNNTTVTTPSHSISTVGRGSLGLLAQSIGGGGGLGLSTQATAGKGGSASVSLVLGNSGTSSGSSSGVTVNSAGSIQTSGDQAQGAIAQSISYGGGVAKSVIYAASSGTQFTASAGSASVDTQHAAASAGSGLAVASLLGSQSSGSGSNSSTVSLSSSSSITTAGARSTALIAQSIAGGGGLADVTAFGLNGGNFNAATVLGGTATSNAGNITLTSSGSITTSGVLADGALAQSIAGGGGSFGVTHQGVAQSGAGIMSFALGSTSQSTSTNAGSVTATLSGKITTSGFGATALSAQSIGGGGGLASYYLSSLTTGVGATTRLGNTSSHTGNGGALTVTSSSDALTTGDYAPAILAQSIGGGGGRLVGNVASAHSAVLGAGAYGGTGGAITSTLTGSVTTSGQFSPGFVAQSIGAGGGLVSAPTTVTTFGASSTSASGAAGTVSITSGSKIATTGNLSPGLVAQSIGLGGGIATVGGVVTFGSVSKSSSSGNTVTVTLNEAITTSGAGSPGVVAMSIGGGGGLALASQTPSSVQVNKGTGAGGNVTVNVNKAVTTTGANSDGVIATSMGGGGGLVLSASSAPAFYNGGGNGSAGKATINLNASVTASGSNSNAVTAKTLNGKDDPEVIVGSGAVVSGGPGGQAILLEGAINNLTNYGHVTTAQGADGLTFVALGDGVTTVTNAGYFVGSATLTGGPNLFSNLAGGIILAGPSLNLGNGLLQNAGILRPGGGAIGGSTLISGNVEQLPSGVIQMAVRPTGGSAGLTINGNANLGGRLGVLFPRNVIITEGQFSNASLLTVNGTLVNAGLSPYNTAMVGNSLLVNGNQIGLATDVNFTPAGLSPGEHRFGRALALLQARGSTPLTNEIVHDLVLVPDVGTLRRRYSDFGGNPLSSVLQFGLTTAQLAMTNYAEQADRWRVGPARPIDQPWMTWIAPYAGFGNWGSISGGLSTTLFGASAGVDVQVLPDLLVGLGASGSQNNISVPTSNFSAVQSGGGAGLYGLARFGNGYVSAATYVGGDHTSTKRSLLGHGLAAVTLDATLASIRIEAGYAFAMNDNVKLTPFATFEPTGRWQNGATETISAGNAFEIGLGIRSQFTKSLPTIIGLQLDARIPLENGSALSGFIRGGWMHDFSLDRSLTKSLAALPEASFTSSGVYGVPNAFVLRMGALYNLTSQTQFFADINSALAANGASLGGQIGLRVNW